MITISASDVRAVTSQNGAAIGAGCGWAGRSQVDVLAIVNCTIVALVDSMVGGSDIGTGSVADGGTSLIIDLLISGSKVVASNALNASVIGSGPLGSDVYSLQFSGDCFIECIRTGTANAINASSILILFGSLTFVVDDAPLFGTSPMNLHPFDMVIFYRQVTSDGCEPLSLLNNTFVHVGNLNVSDTELNSLTFGIQGSGFWRWFRDYPRSMRSFIVSVSGEGPYSFPAVVNGSAGQFEDRYGRTRFDIASPYEFIEMVRFDCFLPTAVFSATGRQSDLNSLGWLTAVFSETGRQSHPNSLRWLTWKQSATLELIPSLTLEPASTFRVAGHIGRTIGMSAGIVGGFSMLVGFGVLYHRIGLKGRVLESFETTDGNEQLAVETEVNPLGTNIENGHEVSPVDE
jgi:hypothetical protein